MLYIQNFAVIFKVSKCTKFEFFWGRGFAGEAYSAITIIAIRFSLDGVPGPGRQAVSVGDVVADVDVDTNDVLA